MARETERPLQEQLDRMDPRFTEIPQPCQHCKHIVSMGSRFDSEGWTCKAFPEKILYGILALKNPHTTPFGSQVGDYLYDPEIYVEEWTGRAWHYTATGGWRYVDEEYT